MVDRYLRYIVWSRSIRKYGNYRFLLAAKRAELVVNMWFNSQWNPVITPGQLQRRLCGYHLASSVVALRYAQVVQLYGRAWIPISRASCTDSFEY